MVKVTKRAVDSLKPSTKDVLLWDDELPGFGVRCRPSGAKVYYLKYRTRAGRQRWLTLGQHGPLTPEKARAKALQEKAAVGDGADPSGVRQQKRHEKTIGELADRYLTEHVAVHNKPSTAAEINRIVERRIKPELGRIKITDLSRADIKAWHQRMSPTPYEANRALAYCSKMLGLATNDWGLRPDNPCLGLRRFPEHARERFFTDAELTRIGKSLIAAERNKSELPGFALLVRLLATTGMRLGEALNLRWPDVDLADRAIRLSDAKAGARTVHLGAAAVVILDAVKEREGFVIRAFHPEQQVSVSVAEKAWARVRTSAGIENGRLHDLRHTAGTFAALSGANAFAVRDLLGHKTLAMTGRYVERAADMVRATADTVSNRVAAAMSASERPPAQVVKLAKRARTATS
jgi:integrase